jgi:hypothetical protein
MSWLQGKKPQLAVGHADGRDSPLGCRAKNEESFARKAEGPLLILGVIASVCGHGVLYLRREGLPTRIRFQWVKPCLRDRREFQFGGMSCNKVIGLGGR